MLTTLDILRNTNLFVVIVSTINADCPYNDSYFIPVSGIRFSIFDLNLNEYNINSNTSVILENESCDGPNSDIWYVKMWSTAFNIKFNKILNE